MRLGWRGKVRTEGHIIGPRPKRRARHFKIGIARRPEQPARTQRLPCGYQVAIVAAQMHAVGITGQRQRQVVIDDEAGAEAPA